MKPQKARLRRHPLITSLTLMGFQQEGTAGGNLKPSISVHPFFTPAALQITPVVDEISPHIISPLYDLQQHLLIKPSVSPESFKNKLNEMFGTHAVHGGGFGNYSNARTAL